jgi:hypothetical protein
MELHAVALGPDWLEQLHEFIGEHYREHGRYAFGIVVQ